MLQTIAAATMVLILVSVPALAQGSTPRPAPGAEQLPVIGQTGTMYDGNNANLELPPDQNAYWARLWAQPGGSGNSGAASAVGAGVAGTSFGATDGGEH